MRVLSPMEKHTVAHHESGHALVALSDPHSGPITKISIVSRGRALGFTRMVDEEQRTVYTFTELQHQLTVALGGRAAEELVLGQPTTSANDDLRPFAAAVGGGAPATRSSQAVALGDP